MFKKFLSATKNKIKAPPHIKMNGGGAGMSSLEDDEEFEARKHEWQVSNAVRSSVCSPLIRAVLDCMCCAL